MTPREIEQLLGGYATDTLTDEERSALFTAALSNQDLFDALADEQALKELLSDPATRAHLLASLDEKRESPLTRALAWLRRPSVLALTGAVAAAVILIVAVRPDRLAKQQQAPAEVATRQTVEPQPAHPPAGAPLAENQPAPAPREEAKRKPAADSAREKLRDKESEHGAKPAAVDQLEGRLARKEEPPPAVAPAPAQPPTPAAAPAPALAPQAVARSESRGQVKSTAQAQETVIAQAPAPARPSIGARDLYYAAGLSKDLANGFMYRSLAGSAKKNKAASGNSAGAGGNVPAPSDRAAGIRYSILQRYPDGSSKEIDPAAPIGIGNQIRIRFEANQEGDLAIMLREPDGAWTLWGKSHARVGEPVYLPADDFMTIAAAGEFHFFVKFARTLPTEAAGTPMMPTPNLLREQSGTSVYAVNPAKTDTAVDFEFTISAR